MFDKLRNGHERVSVSGGQTLLAVNTFVMLSNNPARRKRSRDMFDTRLNMFINF